ncbi:MAG: ABC transporter permease [Hyphomicrobiales bacterium]
MTNYIIRRLAIFPVFLFVVSIVTFLVIRALPGDAALVNLGLGNATCAECREAIRERLGLDKPLPQQYWIWLSNAAHGDLGESTTNRTEIAPQVRERGWNTLQITVASLLLTILLGIPLGAISAVYNGGIFDYLARLVSILGLSIPNFWLGTLIVTLPAVWWGWTPASNWVGWTQDPVEHLKLVLLPATVLAVGSAAYVSRIVRSSMLEALYSDYVRTARAKGLKERAVIFAHVMRNSMLVVLTVLGLQAGVLLGGAVVVESIFSVPGLGLMASQAVLARDYQTLQALIVIFAAWFITVQLIVDITYAWIDPRLSY